VIRIERREYRGWPNSYVLSNDCVELVVLADVGPRVIRYAFMCGENQFHELEKQAGCSGGDDFRLYGGHRLWVWPEVQRTYFPDNRSVGVSINPAGATFTAPIEAVPPGTHLEKSISIALSEQGSHVRLFHSITNHSSLPTKLAPWTPTVMRAGGRGIVPLPPRAAMDQDHFQSVAILALWSFTDFTDSRWILGREFLQLVQQERSSGPFPEQMSGLFNPAGWGAYVRSGCVFLKRAKVIPGAQYPDFGCNFELFTNAEFLELETLGPVVTLEAGQTVGHAEDWWLFERIRPVSDEDSIRAFILPLVAQTTGGS
jgi:hypothetical protein